MADRRIRTIRVKLLEENTKEKLHDHKITVLKLNTRALAIKVKANQKVDKLGQFKATAFDHKKTL